MMRNKAQNASRSLRAKITIAIVIIVLLFQLFFGLLKIFMDRQKTYEDLTQFENQMSSELSETLTAPLWNYDYEQVKKLINHKLQNKNFIGLIIYDNKNNKPLFGLINEKDEIVETTEISEDLYIKVSKDMIFNEEVYWTGDFYFTDLYIRNEISQNIVYSIVTTILLTIITSIFLYFIINKFIITPITKTTLLLKDISEGKGDLTQKIDIKTNDEIGTLARYFNDFISSLNLMIKNIKGITNKTKSISTHLAANSHESLSALEEITKNVEGITSKMTNLDQQVILSNKAAEDVSHFISGVSEHVSEQSSAITESSTAIEEISASINNIAKSTEEKLRITREMEKTANSGSADMNDTIEIIKQVTDSAEVIMEMMTVINEIANQTNLLAMNAAIEAAHAGEKGKGFSVVADEIRKLSEDSGANSRDISSSLSSIMGYIEESESITNKTGESFSSIVDRIKEVAGGMLEIKDSMSELSAGSTEIMGSLKLIIQTTNKVKDSSDHMNDEITKIAESLDILKNISLESKNGIDEIGVGIKEVFGGAEEVSKAGLENAQNINELENLVSQFKTD